MKSKPITDFYTNSLLTPPNNGTDESGLLYKVQFTGYEESENNCNLHKGEYGSFRLAYTISGYYNMTYDGKYYKVDADALAFIDCRKQYETWTSPDGYKIIYVDVCNAHLSELCDYVHKKYSPVIPLANDSIEFRKVIEQMHADIKNGEYDQRVYSQKIYSLLVKLTALIESLSPSFVGVPDYINKLVNFINNNYNSKLTLNVCSEHVNVSPTYLENSFKKHTGLSVAKYVANIRLKKAQKLLTTTKEPISKIAEEVGLEDSQVLIRLFKKNLGITPLTYRKNHQGSI